MGHMVADDLLVGFLYGPFLFACSPSVCVLPPGSLPRSEAGVGSSFTPN